MWLQPEKGNRLIKGSKVFISCFLLLLLWSCGGGPKVSDQQPQTGTRTGPVIPGSEGVQPYPQPTVRILLKKNFQSAEIINSSVSPSARIKVIGSMLELEEKKGGKWQVVDNQNGFRFYPDKERLLGFNRRYYRGIIDVFVNPLGVPVIVNEVGLEEYLRSVVPLELGPISYPYIEALKAQAVAARTFAVRELDRNAVHGFDMYGDSRAQNYAGAGSEDPLSDQAVRETAGIIAVNHGKPILAMYSSTCGGKTEAYHNIFKGSPISYLAGGCDCDDSASPYHRWSETIQVASIQGKLDSYAGIGRLKSLKILKKSSSGRTISMRFTGDKGEKVLNGNDLRFALGLRSNHIDSLKIVAGSDGFASKLVVSGRGWGHGVGLCQIGAVTMARKGSSYQKILHHYYQGIKLVEWDGAAR